MAIAREACHFCEKGVFPGFGLIGQSQPNTLISFIYKGEDVEGGICLYLIATLGSR